MFRIKPGDEHLAGVERETFLTYRDKNGDKVLDREEVATWIMPTDYDHTLNEAKHLIFEADDDKVTHNSYIQIIYSHIHDII